MEILFARGDTIFIVKKNGVFYLVNTDRKEITTADPPDKPDMFGKLGYFEPVDELATTVRMKILAIMNNHKV